MGGAPCRAKSMRSGGSKQQEEEAEAYMAVAARGGHGDAVKVAVRSGAAGRLGEQWREHMRLLSRYRHHVYIGRLEIFFGHMVRAQ